METLVFGRSNHQITKKKYLTATSRVQITCIAFSSVSEEAVLFAEAVFLLL